MINQDLKELLDIYEVFAKPFLERLCEFQSSISDLTNETKETLNTTISDDELVKTYSMLQDFYITGVHHEVGNKLRQIREIAFFASSRRVHWGVDVAKNTGNIRQTTSIQELAAKLSPTEREALIKTLQSGG